MDGKKAAVAVVVKTYRDERGQTAYSIHEIHDEKGNFIQPESDTKTAATPATCHPLARQTPPLKTNDSNRLLILQHRCLGKNKEDTAIRFESKAQKARPGKSRSGRSFYGVLALPF